MPDLNKIIEDLSSLTVAEAAELSKQLEEKWGVTPMAAAAPVAAGGAAPAEDKDDFTIMLVSAGEKKNIRKRFGKLKESLSIPNLIEVQKNSYKELTELHSEAELTKGFDRVFKSIFPIEDLNDKATLEYVSYRLDKPKFDVEE